MTGVAIFRVVLLGLVFLVWAFTAYRILFRFRARNSDETGEMVPGTGGMMKQIGVWWRSPEDRSERNTFLFLTFVLVVMVLTPVLTGTG